MAEPPIIVQPYESQHAEMWDRFVQSESRNGGIFHEQRFLGYHPPERFVDRSLVFFNASQECVGVLPAASLPDSPQSVISHPGSTAGGIIFRSRAGVREVLSLLEAAVLFYAGLGIESLEFRLAEPFASWPSDGELPYLLWHRGFVLLSREISHGVPLQSGPVWEEFGRSRNISYLRSAKKNGLVIRKHERADAIYPLIEANLGSRYDKKPTHSLQELNCLIELYPDRITCWAVEHEGRAIAATVVFAVNKRCVHTFYITQDYGCSNLHPMPFLYYALYETYRDMGFFWFNFGLSSRNEKIKWGILESKEHWGGRSTFKENWRLLNLKEYEPYSDSEIPTHA